MGEDGFSDDLSSYTAATIKRRMADMIHGMSITIVILSPNMSRSRWIPWEIEYSLSEYTRSDRTSHTNGVVCVVQKISSIYPNSAYSLLQGNYNWLAQYNYHSVSINTQKSNWDESKLFSIIKQNRGNKKSWQQSPLLDMTLYNSLPQDYIEIVAEDEFLRNPDFYIESAYKKSQNASSYNITKQVGGTRTKSMLTTI
jgi:hypothetical protein